MIRAKVAAGVLAAALVAVLSGCGGTPGDGPPGDGPQDPLHQTAANLAAIHSGILDMRLEMSTTRGGPVGLTVQGPFQAAADGPQARFVESRMAGTAQQTATLASGHGRVWVIDNGQVRRVDGSAPVVGPSLAGGVPDVHIDRWLRNPTVSDGPQLDGVSTQRITGTAAASAIIEDLAGLLDRAADPRAAPVRLSDADRAQLDASTRAAAVTLVSGRDDHLLRGLDVDLQLSDPAASQSGPLAAYQDLHLVLHLGLTQVNHPVTVDLPS